MTLSEVKVSQGVDEGLDEAGATLEGVWMTGTLLEDGASELVATGITLSEVKVSQGVDEAGLDEEGATLEGVGITWTLPEAGVEGRGAGPVGT